MKSLITLVCLVLLLSFETSEACSSKSAPAKPEVRHQPSTSKNPGRTQVEPEPEAKPTGPVPPKPEMPSMMGCMDAAFPGSPEYNRCMQKYSTDMAKYAKEMKAWNAQYGGNTGDNDVADSGSNSIYSNGWVIKSNGAGANVDNLNGATRISLTPNGRVDQVRGEFLGKNTMQWVLMHSGKQVGWVKVTPSADVDAKSLKYQFTGGALSIWQE